MHAATYEFTDRKKHPLNIIAVIANHQFFAINSLNHLTRYARILSNNKKLAQDTIGLSESATLPFYVCPSAVNCVVKKCLIVWLTSSICWLMSDCAASASWLAALPSVKLPGTIRTRSRPTAESRAISVESLKTRRKEKWWKFNWEWEEKWFWIVSSDGDDDDSRIHELCDIFFQLEFVSQQNIYFEYFAFSVVASVDSCALIIAVVIHAFVYI